MAAGAVAPANPGPWRQQEKMCVLGHWLSADSSPWHDWRVAARACWGRCLRGAGSKAASRLPMKLLWRDVEAAAWPALSFRAGKWVLTRKLVAAIDRLQKQVHSLLLRLRQQPCEDAEAFRLRKSRAAAAEMAKVGPWSGRVAARISDWKSHIEHQEEAQPELWTSKVLAWRDSAWLQRRRVACGSRSALAGRLMSRRCGGYVRERWQEMLPTVESIASTWRRRQAKGEGAGSVGGGAATTEREGDRNR